MALSGMPGTVGAVLRETGPAADRLALEITEGLLLEETPSTRRHCRRCGTSASA